VARLHGYYQHVPRAEFAKISTISNEPSLNPSVGESRASTEPGAVQTLPLWGRR
jgi:hypothetical protein